MLLGMIILGTIAGCNGEDMLGSDPDEELIAGTDQGKDVSTTDIVLETEFAGEQQDEIPEVLQGDDIPVFEMQVPKPYADFRMNMPYDNISNFIGRDFSALWDDIVNTPVHGWLTMSGESGLSITIDMQQIVNLSRIVMHPYHVNSLYSQANITEFEAWGIDKIDFSHLKDNPNYYLDSLSVADGHIFKGVNGEDRVSLSELPARTFKDDWQYLGYHSVPCPLDKEGAFDNEAMQDISAALSQSGHECLVPIDAGPVRYVRIFVRQIALHPVNPNTNYFSCGEITFYGYNTVLQE